MKIDTRYKTQDTKFFTLHPFPFPLSPSGGFNMIELLVVIMIIGILATLVMTAVNPQEQIRRGQDAKRQQEIERLAKALASYYTNNGSQFPPVNPSWITTLKGSNDLSSDPAQAAAGPTGECSTNRQFGYCYAVPGGGGVVVYTVLQSRLNTQGCSGGSNKEYFLWSSSKEQVTKDCDGNDPPTP